MPKRSVILLLEFFPGVPALLAGTWCTFHVLVFPRVLSLAVTWGQGHLRDASLNKVWVRWLALAMALHWLCIPVTDADTRSLWCVSHLWKLGKVLSHSSSCFLPAHLLTCWKSYWLLLSQVAETTPRATPWQFQLLNRTWL